MGFLLVLFRSLCLVLVLSQAFAIQAGIKIVLFLVLLAGLLLTIPLCIISWQVIQEGPLQKNFGRTIELLVVLKVPTIERTMPKGKVSE